MTRFIFTTSIERGDDEIDVRIVYEVRPGTPARLYGDFLTAAVAEGLYPHPEEPAEVELIKAEFVGVDAATMPSPLTDAEFEALQRACEERMADDMAEERTAVADWRYQELRDRQLMERWKDDE